MPALSCPGKKAGAWSLPRQAARLGLRSRDEENAQRKKSDGRDGGRPSCLDKGARTLCIRSRGCMQHVRRRQIGEYRGAQRNEQVRHKRHAKDPRFCCQIRKPSSRQGRTCLLRERPLHGASAWMCIALE